MLRIHRSDVRPEILRRYYEGRFGESPAPDAAYVGATLEEYRAHPRIRASGATSRRLLQNSPVELGFRPRIDDVPSDDGIAREDDDPSVDPRWELLSAREIDLASPELAGRRISASRASIRISGRPTPSRICLIECTVDSESPPPSAFRTDVEHLELRDCSEPCVRSVLASLRSRSLVWHESTRRLSSSLIADWGALERLQLLAPLIEDLRSLAALRLTHARIVRGLGREDFRVGLAGSRGTLRTLFVATAQPLAPFDLAEFSALESLRIEATPERRDEWIDWAVGHAEVAYEFESPRVFVAMTGSAAVEVHRGVPIFRVQRGKKTTFRVEHDLVDLFDLELEDNGELEDKLKAMAKKAKRKVSWGSESGTLVASAATVEDVRWIVDRCTELPKEEPAVESRER